MGFQIGGKRYSMECHHLIDSKPFIISDGFVHFYSHGTLRCLFSTFIYCNALLAGLHLSAIQPLQLIANAAVWLVYTFPKFCHTTPLLCSIQWISVAVRIRYKIQTRKQTSSHLPQSSYHTPQCTMLRSSSTPRHEMHAPSLFIILAPIDVWTTDSLAAFKIHLNSYLEVMN